MAKVTSRSQTESYMCQVSKKRETGKEQIATTSHVKAGSIAHANANPFVGHGEPFPREARRPSLRQP